LEQLAGAEQGDDSERAKGIREREGEAS
jgi:hypothetical protein